MVEVALDRAPHRGLETGATERGVSAFAEIREVAQKQDPERVGPVEQERIIHLDVNAEQVEAGALGVDDVVLE